VAALVLLLVVLPPLAVLPLLLPVLLLLQEPLLLPLPVLLPLQDQDQHLDQHLLQDQLPLLLPVLPLLQEPPQLPLPVLPLLPALALKFNQPLKRLSQNVVSFGFSFF
jgi:hypothetical protein